MPDFCAAYGCSNRRSLKSRTRGITFHLFPKTGKRKRQWELALRRDGFVASGRTVLCSEHFRSEDFDRTGQTVRLKDGVVPTIFNFPARLQKPVATRSRTTSRRAKRNLPMDLSRAGPQPDVAVVNPRSKRYKPPNSKVSPTSPDSSPPRTAPTTAPPSVKNQDQDQEPGETEEESAVDPEKLDRWRIIMDEALIEIESFPYFFHGDYCKPQDTQWAPDDNVNVKVEDPEKLIEVKEPWQWLGLDVRGPFPATHNGHKYILTLTDYYSKWVEALPMQSCLASQVAAHVTDVISHFGYPLRILSRLPHDIVHKINRELKEQLKVNIALVVHHQQTGTADLITQRLIDRMINDLIEEHAADWDIYLPAKVFSLCFSEHSQTKERPFSMLCCKGLEPVQSPRGLNYAYSTIRESAFVVR